MKKPVRITLYLPKILWGVPTALPHLQRASAHKHSSPLENRTLSPLLPRSGILQARPSC